MAGIDDYLNQLRYYGEMLGTGTVDLGGVPGGGQGGRFPMFPWMGGGGGGGVGGPGGGGGSAFAVAPGGFGGFGLFGKGMGDGEATPSQVPHLWSKWARYAGDYGGPLWGATIGQMLGLVEGMTSAERNARMGAWNSAVESGLHPDLFRAQETERQRGFLTDVSGAKAGAGAAYDESLFNLGTATTNAIVQSLDFEKMLALQERLGQMQASAAKSAGQSSMFGDILGGLFAGIF